MKVHPFVAECQKKQIARLYKDGLNDYSKTPELSVTEIAIKKYRNADHYQAVDDRGEVHWLTRVTKMSRMLERDHDFGGGDAAEVGNQLHHAAALTMQGKYDEAIESLTMDEAKHCYDLFLDWLDQFGEFKFLAAECTVFNFTFGVGGTTDIIVETPDNQVVVIDFKTTSHTSYTYMIQQYLYAICLFAIGVRVDKSILLYLPKSHQIDDKCPGWFEEVLWDESDRPSLATKEHLATYVASMNYCKVQKQYLKPAKKKTA